MANRQLPQALKQKQEDTRKETCNTIEEAAKELKSMGCQITRANLIKASKLAASTFSKKHVKEFLLKRWAIGADEIAVAAHPSLEEINPKEFNDLLDEVDDLRKRLASFEEKLGKERSMRKAAEVKQADMEKETKVLRGELDIAQRKVRILSGKKPQIDLVKLFEPENDKI